MAAGAGEAVAVAYFAGLLLVRRVFYAAVGVDEIGQMIRRGQAHRLRVTLVAAIGNIHLRVACQAFRHRREIRLRCHVRRLDSVMALDTCQRGNVALMIEVRDGGFARRLDGPVAVARPAR